MQASNGASTPEPAASFPWHDTLKGVQNLPQEVQKTKIHSRRVAPQLPTGGSRHLQRLEKVVPKTIDTKVCLNCVNMNARGKRRPPCLELHRRANAGKGLTVLGVPSFEVGGGSGSCPWIASWTEVLATLKAMETGKAVYANPTGQTTLRRIKHTFDNYEEKHSRAKWKNLDKDYWAKQADYVVNNGRPEHMGDCMLYTTSGTSSTWSSFLQEFAAKVSVPDLYCWVGVGMKIGGVAPGWPEGRDYIQGQIWNMETMIGKSIQLSSEKFAFGAQANVGTPVVILIGGTKSPADLVGKKFKGGFDVGFSTGIGWTALVKSLFRKEGLSGCKALIKGFKASGKDFIPSKSDLKISGIKSAMSVSGYGKREASLIVLDFPAGACVELTVTLNSTTKVDEVT
ncbi:hypothetical protein CA13_49590 [Planctomycetes bacterium CA13]|uniref:Uncharacterized protein n=1 Tax=Novipirellula herctigrandis TaxID=2527986 RepID=A0A5C5Z857_9BACT|nr:hypothetical protein CA13_49590 [Planctomycetes bacterium CA13]